ncbi:hypothetical protein JYT83_00210 [bacterium AH-315-F18]|nr:hypothetical protein [bacterium AH-315-F18]
MPTQPDPPKTEDPVKRTGTLMWITRRWNALLGRDPRKSTEVRKDIYPLW